MHQNILEPSNSPCRCCAYIVFYVVLSDHNCASTLVTTTRTDAAMSVEDRVAGAIAAVHLKLPPFWPTDPDVWFAQVEAQFSTRGITAQKAKYDYIVASLSPEFATKVRDLILNVPDNPYDTLKQQLIQRTCLPEQRRLQQLFNSTELGDCKPTQLLRRMQQSLGDSATAADGPLLRELFLQRLHANVHMVLASSTEAKSLEEVAQQADKIIDVAPPSLSAVTPLMPTPDSVETLRAEVYRLHDLVSTLPTLNRASRQCSPSPSPQRRRPRAPTPPPSSSPTTHLCWYHARFGDRAWNCTPPCAKVGNSLASR